MRCTNINLFKPGHLTISFAQSETQCSRSYDSEMLDTIWPLSMIQILKTFQILAVVQTQDRCMGIVNDDSGDFCWRNTLGRDARAVARRWVHSSAETGLLAKEL